ncbi:hypothetical protein AYO49_00685 [Verrucomicrobiaceae bacterium SCGC AG-212-N21]|nr:hypothetical protein AYO49_00685 [Verrucomicrobiaceae bacterium SCGC AG-212-N21]
MPRLNWTTIRLDLTEALGELQKLEARVKARDYPNQSEFQVAMQHVYFHLNFAWNARHVTTNRYANLSEEDFEKWGALPNDLQWEED